MKKSFLAGLATGLLLMVVLCFEAAATPILNSTNGHYYDVIDSVVTWDEANNATLSLSYLGLQGHLVTITDASENLFLTDTFGADSLHLHWTGGLQAPNSTEPDGGWSWVTGETFTYQNWWVGEPTNSSDGSASEDRIVFDHSVTSDGKSWNDYIGDWTTLGYVVEYEASPVPEPATFLLFGLGILGVAGVSRKKTA